MFHINGQNQLESYAFSDITLDFEDSSFGFDQTVDHLQQNKITAQESAAILKLFSIANVASDSYTFKVENVFVGNWNISKQADIKALNIIEVDELSSVSVKNLTVKSIDSAASGVILKSKVSGTKSTASTPPVISFE